MICLVCPVQDPSQTHTLTLCLLSFFESSKCSFFHAMLNCGVLVMVHQEVPLLDLPGCLFLELFTLLLCLLCFYKLEIRTKTSWIQAKNLYYS